LRPLSAVAVLTLCLASPAAAQQLLPLANPPTAGEFLPRYDFHLSAAALANSDIRFSWDTHFGGDLDVFDYVVGRTSVVIDYQAVLGDEFRVFDPNQGNYILEVGTSYRVGKTEFAGLLHHVSRHLSDRPKRNAIAWNIVAVRALRQAQLRQATVGMVADFGWVTQASAVDYRWSANLDLDVRRDVKPRVNIFGRGAGHVMGIDQAFQGRSTQAGGEVEGGIRFEGIAGAAEFFVGFERRFDADPSDYQAQRWLYVGFRVRRH
jgi:hypothetical protein